MSKQLNIKDSFSKFLLKHKPSRSDLERFKQSINLFAASINISESEEHNKNFLVNFLSNCLCADKQYFINTKERDDLVIRLGDSNDPVGVIIETKPPKLSGDMITKESLNRKSLQQLLYYFLNERITANNTSLRYLVVTNFYEWFVFDACIFEKLFYDNKALRKEFKDFTNKATASSGTDWFYANIASKYIGENLIDIEFSYFDIREYSSEKFDKKFVELYKFFMPQHILKEQPEKDSNSLNKQFYAELLHIIGLEEVTVESKKLIKRKSPAKQDKGSLIENTINRLKAGQQNRFIANFNSFGDNDEDRYYNIALELVITWINRTLFLKLLEAQIIKYNNDKELSFLRSRKIEGFDDFNSLFFEVLALPTEKRSLEVQKSYSFVPYLNSSLFEPTTLEGQGLMISNLKDNEKLSIYSQTVLTDNGKRKTGSLGALEYIFEFLGAYDFGSSPSDEEFVEESKTIINASVLGLIFEKINGYKDGSYFTPGYITMYICRETIRKAVVDKFNDKLGWKCKDFIDLQNHITPTKDSLDRANEIVNSLKICDPAVGSGHFLVSALNEIIAIKSDLGILRDKAGKLLNLYPITVDNDELVILDVNGDIFEYHRNNSESQRVQETIFSEKRTIIESCLFGVDINPNSVKICQLRLWIELLKHAYYKSDGQLETLPNIDINIKCGNSLVSKYALDSDISQILKEHTINIAEYRESIMSYRNAKTKEEKWALEEYIQKIKTKITSGISDRDPDLNNLRKARGAFDNLNIVQTLDFEILPKRTLKERDALQKKYRADIEKYQAKVDEKKGSKVYINALEWRFEFPEVLSDDGDYIGFDAVIGNPPYIKEPENRAAFDGTRELPSYQGKMDIWYHFLYKGHKIANANGGQIAFIATNNWVTNSGAKNIRNIVINNCKLLSLIDFGSYLVFDSASIQTMIMRFSNNTADNDYTFDYRHLLKPKADKNNAANLLAKCEDAARYLTPTINRARFEDAFLTFTENEDLLSKLEANPNTIYLTEKELAQGIVFPQDFLNKKNRSILGNSFVIGEGIFGLNTDELQSLGLPNNEKSLIKPYYTTEQIHRYYSSSQNMLWLIYTDSKFKKPNSMDDYPILKAHLDRFAEVITSDNKPYGLHRAREERFFQGDKIIVQRKCAGKPSFSYSDFDCYVSATFYVIKTERVHLKYLTGLLNSKLIEFWLKNKGKMQGDNYQLDKEPLQAIPIVVPDDIVQLEVATLVDNIIAANGTDSASESNIDQLIYKLYNLTEDEIGIIEK